MIINIESVENRQDLLRGGILSPQTYAVAFALMRIRLAEINDLNLDEVMFRIKCMERATTPLWRDWEQFPEKTYPERIPMPREVIERYRGIRISHGENRKKELDREQFLQKVLKHMVHYVLKDLTTS